MRIFIWSGDVAQRKICIVDWHVVCKPRDEGGLSMQDPSLVNKDSLLHLTWKLLTSNEQWAVLCRARFSRQGKPKSNYFTSSVWHGMKLSIISMITHPGLLVMGSRYFFGRINGLIDPFQSYGRYLMLCIPPLT